MGLLAHIIRHRSGECPLASGPFRPTVNRPAATFRSTMSKICYFDANATTRVAPEVVEAMLPFLTERWGNPSSAYAFGNQVARQIEAARGKAAALLNADPREIVFTSCGTES